MRCCEPGRSLPGPSRSGLPDGDQLRRTFAPSIHVNDVLTSAAPNDPQFRSRPDLRIPGLSIATTSAKIAPGLIFIGPYNAPKGQQAGAVIVDETGEPVWERGLPYGQVTTDLRLQTYRGRPVLTWWEGEIVNGHGVGHYVIAGEHYQHLRHVQAGNRLSANLHEFVITPRDTALLTAYSIVPMDLAGPIGGPRDGTIRETQIIQELNLASGRVLFEWHSLKHIPLAASYYLPVYTPWDYVHLRTRSMSTSTETCSSARATPTPSTRSIAAAARSSGSLAGACNQLDIRPVGNVCVAAPRAAADPTGRSKPVRQ